MLKKCTCGDFLGAAARFQNEKYGYGIRVHNLAGGKSRGKCRCTICDDTKDVGSKAVAKKPA